MYNIQYRYSKNFDYGYNVWYRGLAKSFKVKLQTTQNKIVRYIGNTGSRSHVGYNELLQLKWLSVQKRIDYLTLSSVYNVFTNSAPAYMLNQFSRTVNQHSHHTRNAAYSFSLPSVKSHGHNSFLFNGIKKWNSCNKSVKMCSSKDVFKSKCKLYLMEEMRKEECNDFVY